MSGSPILIIAYKFPPYPGIGGRRWAKFARCLADLDYKVHVICATNTLNSISLWMEDIQHPNITVYTFESKYPEIINSKGTGLIKKTRIKLNFIWLMARSKGTPYDLAVLDHQLITNLARNIIQQNKIKTVIATGAPFRSLYYAALLKDELGFNLISDFRDPWTWGKNYGFTHLSAERMQFEKQMEQKVMDASDVVFVPVQPMQTHLNEAYPTQVKKIKLLPHGFDTHETGNYPRNASNQKVRLIHIGTIYYTSKEEIEKLAAVLSQRKNEIELHFYTSDNTFQEIFEAAGLLGTVVKYFKPVPPQELFKLIRTYHYFLLIHAKAGANNISTKFYEVMATKTPILFIAPEGIAGKFVVDNGVGIHCKPEEVTDIFKKLSIEEFSFDLKFNLEDYTFAALTQNMIVPAIEMTENTAVS
jgi:hydroxymethylpyrimidine pyrophosphatase-like HAD family hydrolase